MPMLLRFGPLPLLLLAAIVLGLTFGTVSIAPPEILQILAYKLGLPGVHAAADIQTRIIWDIRLPRVLAAALVGAALALAGALFQAVLRNPLADPYVIGTSAGAQLGVTLALLLPFQFAFLGFGWSQVAAFTGALLTVLFVFSIARTGGRTPIVTLILAGFAVSSFLISATTFAAYANNDIGHVFSWTLGGIAVDEWTQLGAVAFLILLSSLLAILLSVRLDVILLGEEQAAHLGIRVERLKIGTVVLASLLTALAVSLSGIVAFVGLIVPHVMRLVYGPGHRILLPAVALGGAAFLVLADLVARIIIAPTEVPLGIMTAIIGAPFFLHLLRRSRRAYGL
jgi:iron complex transport system permease protein